ncbi:MAG: hypothetical protein ACO2PM_21740, partial [Pyrobaculum sp.]
PLNSSPTSTRIPRTSLNSLNITADSRTNKKLRIDECKEWIYKKQTRQAETYGRRRRIEEAGRT